MIKVTIGNNLKRENVIIDENTTLRSALERLRRWEQNRKKEP